MMPIRRQKPNRVARGVVRAPGRRRIIIEFDDEMFAAIRDRAIRQHVTFAEALRTLVQWGLDEDDDGLLSDDLAPTVEASPP